MDLLPLPVIYVAVFFPSLVVALIGWLTVRTARRTAQEQATRARREEEARERRAKDEANDKRIETALTLFASKDTSQQDMGLRLLNELTASPVTLTQLQRSYIAAALAKRIYPVEEEHKVLRAIGGAVKVVKSRSPWDSGKGA